MGFLSKLFGRDEPVVTPAAPPPPAPGAQVAAVRRQVLPASIQLGPPADPNDAEAQRAQRNVQRVLRLLDEKAKLERRISTETSDQELVQLRKQKLDSVNAEIKRRTAHLAVSKELIEKLGL